MGLLLLLLPMCGREETPGSSRSSPDVSAIRLGAILPLSGPNARYGKWVQEGLELCVAESNAEGGIAGRKLQIIYEDDQAQPRHAASAMMRLVDTARVPLVYGSWASSCVLAQAPIAERSKTIIIAQAISPKIRDAGEYVFRSLPDANHSLAKLVPFAIRRGAIRAAVLYVNNDYGVDQDRVFQQEFTRLGGTVVLSEGYAVGEVDFRTALAKLKKQRPDTVFLPGYSEVGIILKQARELGIKAQFYSSDPFENEDVLETAGAAADGVFYPFFYNSRTNDKRPRAFEEAYRHRYGHEPEGTAALAYNAMTLVVDALRRVGPDATRLKDWLLQVKDYPGPLGAFSIDDHGDFLLPVYMKTVVHGTFVVVEY